MVGQICLMLDRSLCGIGWDKLESFVYSHRLYRLRAKSRDYGKFQHRWRVLLDALLALSRQQLAASESTSHLAAECPQRLPTTGARMAMPFLKPLREQFTATITECLK